MSVQDQIFDRIAESKGLNKNELKPETTFLEIGADSLDMVEFSIDLEEAFKIEIKQEDIAGIKTLGQAVEFVEKNKKSTTHG